MNCNNVLFENAIILSLLSWADKYSNVRLLYPSAFPLPFPFLVTLIFAQKPTADLTPLAHLHEMARVTLNR